MTQREQNQDPSHLLVLQRIYAEYDGFIQAVIRYAAKNQADREDIYQEVFLTLFGRMDLDQVQDIKSYLYRLVLNKSNEFLRSKISRECKHKQFVERHPMKAVQDDEAVQLDIVDEVDGLIDLMRERLSEKEAEAILLRYKDQYDIDEAAEKMNVHRKTLIHYVSVGLKKLRGILKSTERAE